VNRNKLHHLQQLHASQGTRALEALGGAPDTPRVAHVQTRTQHTRWQLRVRDLQL
jgi:hypothetical protein